MVRAPQRIRRVFQAADDSPSHYPVSGIRECSLAFFELFVSYGGIAIGYQFRSYGVPVRDYIAQSGEFILCVVGLLYVAMTYWEQRRTTHMFALLALILLFLANVFYVSSSRTSLVTVPLLLILFAVTQCRWKQMFALLASILVVAAIVWTSSTYVQERILGIFIEIETHGLNNRPTSSGERVEFWRQSLAIIETAPVIGHGTGSVKAQFAAVVAAEKSNRPPTVNPHNQTFMVAIQLGVLGSLALYAMWIAHFTLFLRGAGLVSWIGLAVVTQNIVGCLFNTHLFDVVQGWIYFFGVGAAGGWMLKHTQPEAQPAANADSLAV